MRTDLAKMPEENHPTRLLRMSTQRWMIVTAVVAVDLAGMLCGSDELSFFFVFMTAAAPVLITIGVLARRLGPSTLGR